MLIARLALALSLALLAATQGCASGPRGLDLGPPATFYGMQLGATLDASPMPGWVSEARPALGGQPWRRLLDGVDDQFAVLGPGEAIRFVFVAPPAGPDQRRLAAVVEPLGARRDPRFIEGEEAGHVGVLSVRRSTQPGLFTLWTDRDRPCAVLVGPDDLQASGLFPALEKPDLAPERVRDGSLARDVARAKQERWSFARTRPLLQEIAAASANPAWLDASEFTEKTVNALVLAREDDWVNEIASAPVSRASFEETRALLLDLARWKDRAVRSGGGQRVAPASAASRIADRLPEAWIETRKAQGRTLAVASALVRVKGKEGVARRLVIDVDLMPQLHLASATPRLAEEAAGRIPAILANMACVQAVGAPGYFPLEPITWGDRPAGAGRRRVTVTIEESSTLDAQPAGEKLVWVEEVSLAWEAWRAKQGSATPRSPEPPRTLRVQRKKMHWAYTGGIRWRAVVEGSDAPAPEVAVEVPASMDPTLGEASARSALRAEALAAVVPKIVQLLLPEARARLERYVTRFPELTVREEEERCGRAFLGE